MRKRIIPACALICIFAVVMIFHTQPDKPDTNLEFWICDNVDTFDFSDYLPRHGIMGGREYYGTGYVPKEDENGIQTDPEHCVIYTVTAYPDYASKHSHITQIRITDPAVMLYGIGLHSSFMEIDAAMEKNGYKQKEYANAYGTTYTKGKVSIHFTEDCISIHADVSNFWGIQF